MPDDAPVTRIVEPAICMVGERSIGVDTARGARSDDAVVTAASHAPHNPRAQ
jgi:hypothetical protein